MRGAGSGSRPGSASGLAPLSSRQAYDLGMPAGRIDQAVRRLSPDSVVCWCNGQRLESRYSASTAYAGAAGGRRPGRPVLRHQRGKARPGNAVPMPRFPVAAVSARRIYLFRGPAPDKEAFAVLPQDQAQVVHGGNTMRRRLDIHTTHDGVPRSYTMMVSGLGSGRKRLQETDRRTPVPVNRPITIATSTLRQMPVLGIGCDG